MRTKIICTEFVWAKGALLLAYDEKQEESTMGYIRKAAIVSKPTFSKVLKKTISF